MRPLCISRPPPVPCGHHLAAEGTALPKLAEPQKLADAEAWLPLACRCCTFYNSCTNCSYGCSMAEALVSGRFKG